MKKKHLGRLLAGLLASAGVFLPHPAQSHCDTMDGPVIQAAREALAHKDVTPVLKWVKPDNAAEIKAAFARSLTVRGQSPEARQLADQFFFETLVRIHRAGEGAPFTGLKASGTEVEPAVREADRALDNGSIEKLVKLVTEDAAAGIRKRFAEAREKQKLAETSVEAGRSFVAAYVEYVHYVEGLHQAAQGAGAHEAEAGPVAEAHEAPAPHHAH